MLDGIGLGWTDVGAGGLLVLTVLLVLSGKLVPKRYMDDAVSRALAELGRETERADKAEKQRDEAFELAQSMTDMNVALVHQKDAAVAAVESVKAYAERQGDSP